MNRLTHPPVGPSGLRYMTRLAGRVWSASIICELGQGKWLLDREMPSQDVSHALDQALIALRVSGYPKAFTGKIEPLYAFEQSLAQVATAWAMLIPNETESEPLDPESALRMTDEASAVPALHGFVTDLMNAEPDQASRAAHLLRNMVHFEPGVGDALWAVFKENDCWREVLGKTESGLLGTLFEALTELQVERVGPWPANLSHMFAAAAEEASDTERRQLLFGMTLFASIHASGVSAIDRLMHGSYRSEFATFTARWLDQIAPVLRALTPWAAGRLRSVLPSLTLDKRDADLLT